MTDRSEAERAHIEGTPSLFINGRLCEPLVIEDIEDRYWHARHPEDEWTDEEEEGEEEEDADDEEPRE